MKRAILVAVVAVLAVGGKFGLAKLFTAGEENNARERVRRILDGMKPGGDRQQAICLWSRGTLLLGSQEEFNAAADGFEAWTGKKEFNRVAEYEITEAKAVEERLLGTAVVIVSARIDGKPLTMRVVQGTPIEWVD